MGSGNVEFDGEGMVIWVKKARKEIAILDMGLWSK